MSRARLYQPVNVGLFGQSSVDYAAAVASYSSDTIGMQGAVRRPFEMDGAEWVCIGSAGRGYPVYTCSSIRIYKLVAAADFKGKTVTYGERVAEAQAGGDSVRAVFYHGMKVKHRGRSLVLVGPEYELLAEPVVIREERAAVDELEEDFELEPEYEEEDAAEPMDFIDALIGKDERTEEELNASAAEGRRRMDSTAICGGCGHQEKDHFSVGDRGCHWSQGHGATYQDCECNCFASLPPIVGGCQGGVSRNLKQGMLF